MSHASVSTQGWEGGGDREPHSPPQRSSSARVQDVNYEEVQMDMSEVIPILLLLYENLANLFRWLWENINILTLTCNFQASHPQSTWL